MRASEKGSPSVTDSGTASSLLGRSRTSSGENGRLLELSRVSLVHQEICDKLELANQPQRFEGDNMSLFASALLVTKDMSGAEEEVVDNITQ